MRLLLLLLLLNLIGTTMTRFSLINAILRAQISIATKRKPAYNAGGRSTLNDRQ